MRKSSPRPKSLRPTLSWLLCFFLVVSAILAPYEATYAAYDGVRPNSFKGTTCDTSNGDKGKKFIDYDPIGANGTNFDFQIELTNPTCLAFIAATGMAMIAASKISAAACGAAVVNSAAGKPYAVAQATDVPYPNPTTPIRAASATATCATMLATTISYNVSCVAGSTPSCPIAATSTTESAMCCASITAYLAAIAAMFAALAIIHGLANQAYHTGKICGSEWYGWEQLNADGVQDDSGIWTRVKGPHQKCLINVFSNPDTPLSNATGCERGENENEKSITNKNYREYIYGGVEKPDNSNDACTNPTTWSKDRRNRILGYDTDEQRYYMTGPGMAPSYACYRFLAKAIAEGGNTAEQDQAAMQKSYDCCKSRSQNAVCIESEAGSRDMNNKVTSPDGVSSYDNSLEVNDDSELEKTWYNNSRHKFCTIGSKCENNGIFFEAYASTQQVNYACVKTYSSCPYNHLLGGGTEKKKESGGNLENFCQFMKHCSKLPVIPYVRTSNLTGAYIDSSCRDMRGDSQNYFSYQVELLQSKTTGFTAPIVQCFKETMQNIFLNEAGYTECLDPDEIPDENDECSTGYRLREGFAVSGDSFFIKIQKKFQLLIKIVLTISVTFYGVMILLAVPKSYIERKNLFPYILKLALVCYFTLGTAWQDILISGVLETSGTLAAITFKPDNQETSKLDGCQFPRWNYADDNSDTKYDNPSYPPGKEYLEVWDILDCKIAKALGFGPSLSVPNLIFMILGGFFTGGLGIVFVVAAFIFAFFLIFMTIRALQFFLVAMTSVIILMYISVFIIPLCLFNRTKEIFNKWWKNMLGFILQPMILFAYLGILIAIFDNIVIGSATFTTTGTITKVDGVTKYPDDKGQASEKTISCNSKAEDDSIYCIFRIADIKTYNGFEALGVGLPILGSMNASKLITIIKGALLMYIFSTFMDKIAEVAATLVGGSQISSSWSDSFKPHEMAMKAGSVLQGVQSRGMAVTRAAAGSVLRKGGELAGKVANQGKRKVEATEKSGADSAANSRAGVAGADAAINSRAEGTGSDNSRREEEKELVGGGGESKNSSTGNDSDPKVATEPSTTNPVTPASDPAATSDSSSAATDKEARDKGSDPKVEPKIPTTDSDSASNNWDLTALASRALAALAEAATEVAETATEVAGAAAETATEVAGAAQKAGADIYSAAMGEADTNSAASASASADASTSEVATPPPPPPPPPPPAASQSNVVENGGAPGGGGNPDKKPSSVKSNVASTSKGQGSGQSRYMFSTKEGGKPSSVKSNAPSTSKAPDSTSSGGKGYRENKSSELRKKATDDKKNKKK